MPVQISLHLHSFPFLKERKFCLYTYHTGELDSAFRRVKFSNTSLSVTEHSVTDRAPGDLPKQARTLSYCCHTFSFYIYCKSHIHYLCYCCLNSRLSFKKMETIRKKSCTFTYTVTISNALYSFR